MKIFINNLIILVIFINGIQSDCDVCQSTNNVACHKENQYSLCINGVPTRDYITCPENHVCTPDPYVCYPLPEAQTSCVRNGDLCGVCSFNKVYACINETTIAFCYGQDKPYEGADVSYCLDNTVCDLFSEHGFCTEKHLAKPSCVTTSEQPATTEITTTDTTTQYSTTTVSSTTKATTTTEIPTVEPSTTTTKPSSTTPVPTTTESIITTTEISTTKATTTEPATTTESSSTKPTITTEIPSTTTTEPSTTTSLPTTSTTTTTTESSTITTEIPTVEPTTTTTEPSTTTSISTPIITTTESTVPSEPNDPDEFCKQQTGAGFYYAGDPTCTTFIICIAEGDTLVGLKKSCKEGQYFPPGAKFCSDKKTDECISATTTTVEPSTTESTTVESTTTTSTTTTTTEATVPSGPRDPDAVCKDETETGSYPNGDPTCTTFVVCYFMGESLKGIQKSCKAGQYFSSTIRLCTDKKPDGCI